MDTGLVRWARAVKQRRRSRLPVLWLFTDAARLADPAAAARGLPKGAGIVLRHRQAAGRRALAEVLAPVCRERGIVLVVAGDVALAAAYGAGNHLGRGRWCGVRRGVRRGPGLLDRGLITASAHNPVELRRARRAGAAIIFFSPVYPTQSHPDGAALGPVRFASAARKFPVYALGGISGANIRRLGTKAAGAGAITALQ